MTYRFLLGVDLIAGAIIAFFFFTGLQDGSVSDFNAGLWAGMLLALAAILGGGIALHRSGKTVLANLLLAVLAAPALFFGLFMLAVIVSGERWN